MSDWNRRFILGVGGPVFVGLLVFAAIVLPGQELRPVRFAVGAAFFLFTAWGLSVLANRLLSNSSMRRSSSASTHAPDAITRTETPRT
ncbi:hypothetical protein ACFU99_25700 [Streptomyces sp. NPDC057654]|uniref:hypothetical protein n=1 Tax=Streptomyces sp. NPDC057654 TaxID=3346196 RepID=UPI003694DE5F